MTVKVEEVLKRLRALQEKFTEEVDALEAILNDAPTPAQEAKQLLTHFGRAWTARYREKYVPSYPREIPICKRILGGLTLEDAKRRAERYLADADPFYVRARHPLGLLRANLNKFGNGQHQEPEPYELTSSAPRNCRHDPPCRTAAQHTKREVTEMRGDPSF